MSTCSRFSTYYVCGIEYPALVCLEHIQVIIRSWVRIYKNRYQMALKSLYITNIVSNRHSFYFKLHKVWEILNLKLKMFCISKEVYLYCLNYIIDISLIDTPRDFKRYEVQYTYVIITSNLLNHLSRHWNKWKKISNSD